MEYNVVGAVMNQPISWFHTYVVRNLFPNHSEVLNAPR